MNELLNYKKYANKYGEQSHLIGRSSEQSSVSPLALFYLVFNTTIHLIFLVLLLSLSLQASSHGLLSHVSLPPWPSPLHPLPQPDGVHNDGHRKLSSKTLLGKWGTKRNDSMVTISSHYKALTSQIRGWHARIDELHEAMDDKTRLVTWDFFMDRSFFSWCKLLCVLVWTHERWYRYS
jgi:hypothetical protein